MSVLQSIIADSIENILSYCNEDKDLQKRLLVDAKGVVEDYLDISIPKEVSLEIYQQGEDWDYAVEVLDDNYRSFSAEDIRSKLHRHHKLDSTNVGDYEHLMPEFHYNNIIERSGRFICLGASCFWRPLGVIKVCPHPEEGRAVLEFFYVAQKFRHEGIGRGLLENVEQILRVGGFEKLRLIYYPTSYSSSGVEQVEKLLAYCGYSVPKVFWRSFTGQMTILQPKFDEMKSFFKLPVGYEVACWSDITPRDKDIIEGLSLTDHSLTPDLVPFNNEHLIEPLTSFVLRYRGELIGWHTSHRVAFDRVHFHSLYVRPEYRGTVIMLAFFKNVWHQYYKLRDKIPYFSYTIEEHMLDLADCLQEFFALKTCDIEEKKIVEK